MEDEIDITKLKYVLYARKSTIDEDRQVRSIEDQITECLDTAKRLGLNVINKDNPFTESKTAKIPNQRPLFTQMLKDLRKGKYDGILAWHPDRLARNMLEGGEIIDMVDQGYIKDLKFVTHHFSKDANGKMLLGMAFVLSKQYSDHLSESVTRGVRRNLAEGKSGIPKHGFIRADDGTYKPDGNNHKIVSSAWLMRREGYTLDDIVKYMSESGYSRTIKKSGEKVYMTEQTLSKMFNDPFHYGILVQTNQTVDLRTLYDFEPTVSQEDYFIIQDRMNKKNKPHKIKDTVFYPFKKLILCSFCGEIMYIGASKGSSGNRYLNARCDTPKCTRKKKSIRMKNILIDFIYKFLDDGLNFTAQEYTHYYDNMRRLSDENKLFLKGMLHNKEGLLKKVSRDKTNIALKIIHLPTTSPIYRANEKRILELEEEEGKLSNEIKEIREKLSGHELEKLTIEEFLNLSKNAATIVKTANPIAKDQICRKIFLNFKVDEEKVVSYQLKEPFITLLKNREISFGRDGET